MATSPASAPRAGAWSGCKIEDVRLYNIRGNPYHCKGNVKFGICC